LAVTVTVGGSMLGYWDIGKPTKVSKPPSTMTMDTTAAKMGLLMKKRENI